MIGVFVPIFLLEGGCLLVVVLIYYTVIYAVTGVCSPVSALVIEKVGDEHTSRPHPLFAVF